MSLKKMVGRKQKASTISPLTPIRVFVKNGEIWGNSERRIITRSLSKQLKTKVFDNKMENNDLGIDLFRHLDTPNGVIVCGLTSNHCDSVGFRRVRGCKVVGSSMRMVTRSASKAMVGKVELGGEIVEVRKKERVGNKGLSECVGSRSRKRVTRSSVVSSCVSVEEELGIVEDDGCCRLDGELDVVSCDPVPICSLGSGAKRRVQDDISEETKLVVFERNQRGTKVKGMDQRWTKEQEVALRNAYFTAKPSPQFWKRVAKVVPGKSAQECFDKMHSNNLTPLSTRPSSRAKKCNSPSTLSFSGSKLFKSAEKKSKKPGKAKMKMKSHIAHRNVRQLLQKYSYVNQDSEADLFSVLEPTVNPSTEAFHLNPEQSTPKHKFVSPGSSSLSHKKRLSRLSGANLSPLTSPPVLKKVKNLALHEKYIDQLHVREAKRKVASTRYLKAIRRQKDGEENPATAKKDVIRAAKDALYSDARDAIHKFQHSQTNIKETFSDFEELFSNDDEEEETML